MNYMKPEIMVYDDQALNEIKAYGASCTAGCGGGTNMNCGTTSYCSSVQPRSIDRKSVV